MTSTFGIPSLPSPLPLPHLPSPPSASERQARVPSRAAASSALGAKWRKAISWSAATARAGSASPREAGALGTPAARLFSLSSARCCCRRPGKQGKEPEGGTRGRRGDGAAGKRGVGSERCGNGMRALGEAPRWPPRGGHGGRREGREREREGDVIASSEPLSTPARCPQCSHSCWRDCPGTGNRGGKKERGGERQKAWKANHRRLDAVGEGRTAQRQEDLPARTQDAGATAKEQREERKTRHSSFSESSPLSPTSYQPS